jgi:PAS domain S-box-containing protein
MKSLLRILFVEDSEDDALLVLHQIKKGGYDVEYERVETAEKMREMLKEKTWDIILSDYKMPHFDGLEALAILNESGLDLPFIIISGTIGEEVAVEAMKASANDYIMKNNLKRLLPAIERELRESKNRAERKLLKEKENIAERERLANLNYFESMDKINQSLKGTKNLDDTLSDLLDIALSIFDCDRAWLVYPCDLEATSWKVLMEKTRPEFPGALAMDIEVPVDSDVLELFRTLLSATYPTQFLPNEIAHRFSFQSQITIAIHPKVGKPWVFGLHQCSYPRTWTLQEERLFKEIGRRLADSLTSLLILKDLMESEEKYRKMTLNSPLGMHFYELKANNDLVFIDSNPAADKILGIDHSLLYGKTIEQAFPPLANTEVPIRYREAASRGKFWTTEQITFKDNKNEGAFELRAYQTKPNYMVAVFADITQRKRTEEALRLSEANLQLAMEAARMGNWSWDIVTGEVVWSTQCKALYGLSPETVVTYELFLGCLYPEDRERIDAALRRAVDDKSDYDVEKRCVWPDGSMHWNVSSGRVICNTAGKPIRMVGVTFEITERINAEKALKVSEELYRTLIDTSPDAVAVTDPEGFISFISNKSLEIFGNSSIQEVIGHNFLEWVAPQDREKAGRNFKYLVEGGSIKDKEYSLLKENGSTFWGETNAAPVYGTDGKLQSIIIVTRDISERKKTEESIRKLSLAVEQSPASIIITDVKGNIEYVNPKFSEITRYSLEEVIGKNPRILKSGTMSSDNYKQMWNDIIAGKEWHGEFHNKKKNGEYYWESASISPIFNSKDEITNFLAIKQDITEQKRMTSELVEAKEKAEEMNKVKTYFFANMSHELRTPFVGIMGFSELLAETLINSEEKKYAEQILKSSKRLTDTLNKILNVAKIEFDGIEISNSDLSVDKTVGEITDLYTQSAKVNNTELITDLKFGSSKIRSDKELLEEILDNLISNAVKYTKNGRVVVSSEKIQEDEKVYLILKVADTGVGIPEEMQKVVWREFRQASEGFNRSFEGTGLGLTITKKYVDRLNGIISLVSEEGKGTLFTIKLPVTFASKDKVKVEKLIKHTTKVDTDINKPKYKVLYVEDDAIALQYITIVLKSLYDIETTLTAKSALDLINKNQYDVVMLDINLGRGMDGVQLMQEIKKIELYKGIPFVAVTAYAAESDRAEFFAKGFSHYISKPFSSTELKELLAKIVEEFNNQND